MGTQNIAKGQTWVSGILNPYGRGRILFLLDGAGFMKRNGVLLLAWACLAIGAALPAAGADPPSGEAKVQAALAEMHRWTGEGATGQGWRKFLKSDVLSAELAKGAGANPQVIADVLAQYESGKPGLHLVSKPSEAPPPELLACRRAPRPAAGRPRRAAKFQPVTPDQWLCPGRSRQAVGQLDHPRPQRQRPGHRLEGVSAVERSVEPAASDRAAAR
jgi:hypothetical protein